MLKENARPTYHAACRELIIDQLTGSNSQLDVFSSICFWEKMFCCRRTLGRRRQEVPTSPVALVATAAVLPAFSMPDACYKGGGAFFVHITSGRRGFSSARTSELLLLLSLLFSH